MKIAMVMNGNGVGGAELQFAELANHLAATHEVTLVCLQGVHDALREKLSPAVEICGFTYETKWRSVSKLRDAVSYVRARHADVIITTSDFGDVVGAMAKSQGTRLISLQTVSAAKHYPWLDAWALKRFDTLVAGCEDIRRFLENAGQPTGKIRAINNWVDFSQRNVTAARQDVLRTLGIQGANPVIGCIGRMHHQKGQEFLIRAFKTIAHLLPHARLILVGDGPRMHEMRAEADEHERIMFTGTVTGEEYNNLLGAFDIYVQPSRYEGLPRTLLDAMHMGLPVIASEANGMADTIEDGLNGLSVPIGDKDALADALVRLAQNVDLRTRLGKEAKRVAASDYSINAQMEKFDRLVAG